MAGRNLARWIELEQAELPYGPEDILRVPVEGLRTDSEPSGLGKTQRRSVRDLLLRSEPQVCESS